MLGHMRNCCMRAFNTFSILYQRSSVLLLLDRPLRINKTFKSHIFYIRKDTHKSDRFMFFGAILLIFHPINLFWSIGRPLKNGSKTRIGVSLSQEASKTRHNYKLFTSTFPLHQIDNHYCNKTSLFLRQIQM